MTILEAIKEANAKANVRTFRFSDLRSEESFWLTGGNVEDLPVHILVPFEQRWNWVGNRIKISAEFNGWFLTNIKQDINDYKKEDIELLFLEPMRKLCRVYFKHLFNTQPSIIDPEENASPILVAPEYQFINHGALFGISYRATIPFVSSIC
jgi:hypothetical protein